MEEFCYVLDDVANISPYIVCYGVSAILGFSIALVELLSRYGSGNNPRWIIFGKPQFAYYTINAIAAVITLFVAEATGASSIISDYSVNVGMAIIKSAEAGIAAMFALRSSLISIEKGDKKTRFDIGPAQILNILNRYLDRRMDQNRGTAAIKEVAEIMKDFDLNLMDLGALCLAVPESIPAEDMVTMRKNIEAIRKSKDFSPSVKSMMVGIQLQKEVGADNLRAAVEVMKSNFAQVTSSSLPPAPGDVRVTAGEVPSGPPSRPPLEEEAMVSSEEQVDDELSALYNELNSGVTPAVGKEGGANDFE